MNRTMTNWDVFKGFAGSSASLSAFAMSYQPAIEGWLRISTLIVGLCIGLLTLRGLLKNPKK